MHRPQMLLSLMKNGQEEPRLLNLRRLRSSRNDSSRGFFRHGRSWKRGKGPDPHTFKRMAHFTKGRFRPYEGPPAALLKTPPC